MALPVINQHPKYSVKIPSTGKTITYRPFVVKEQKILLMAVESQDSSQILQSITDTIKSCVIGPIDVEKLATFDVEYIFTQIRSKSVGEVANITVKCSSCAVPNPVQINLQEITVDLSNQSPNKIQLTDEYTLVLKYPSYADITKKEQLIRSGGTGTQTFIELAKMSLDTLLTDDEAIDLTAAPQKEIDDFIDNLTEDQFKKILEFIQNVPTLSHTLKFNCVSCKHPNEYKIQGIQDFF